MVKGDQGHFLSRDLKLMLGKMKALQKSPVRLCCVSMAMWPTPNIVLRRWNLRQRSFHKERKQLLGEILNEQIWGSP